MQLELLSQILHNQKGDVSNIVTQAAKIFGKTLEIKENQENHFQTICSQLKRLLAEIDQKNIQIEIASITDYVYSYYMVKFVKMGATIQSKHYVIIAPDEAAAFKKLEAHMISDGCSREEWVIGSQGVLPISTKYDTIPITDNKPIEPVIPAVVNYINQLEYAKFHFTNTTHEQGILTKIINRIKTKYEKPN